MQKPPSLLSVSCLWLRRVKAAQDIGAKLEKLGTARDFFPATSAMYGTENENGVKVKKRGKEEVLGKNHSEGWLIRSSFSSEAYEML